MNLPTWMAGGLAALMAVGATTPVGAADAQKSNASYSQAYGETKAAVSVDPAKDLPHYPPVEPKDAIATWRIKQGFKLELAAHEPQVRDPIAVCFDENGCMFVCEMIDYSERRDVTPHLGRISMLEDKDADGRYETSTVFADDLPWPTGLIWANGALYVGATPDIWRFQDRDGDGHAEVRERIFTGFSTGAKLLNVQSMMNSFQWGQDNRVHVQTGGGNRGKVRCLTRTDLPEEELAGRDFWFDPRSHVFGFEGGGAQYGMSFDNYGRKFACSNADHLQFWVYDERYAARNPFFTLPRARQSIAADGGAAEVFRISPDEPWRIIRTRWRIGGVIKGVVEGGGRVSGYFTGATGTTVYRGDAYGPDFVNNTFTGDAGGQLVHRKKICPQGVSLVGRRPDDEKDFEFAASTDTWVRAVNFANAPDGCLHVCDMYREVIEHPWSLPEEIKKYLDLNNGNDRGRIYRIVPTDPSWRRRSSVRLGQASSSELVKMLDHTNGWHRDTATRLLYERQDRSVVPALVGLVGEAKSPEGKLHALAVLDGFGALSEEAVIVALNDGDAHVRERGVLLAEQMLQSRASTERLAIELAKRVDDPGERVRLQLAFTLESALAAAPLSAPGASNAKQTFATAYVRLALRDSSEPWLSAALLSGPPEVVNEILFPAFTKDPTSAKRLAPFVANLVEIAAASTAGKNGAALIDFVSQKGASLLWLRALGEGLRRAGSSIESVDTEGKLAAAFARVASTAGDAGAPVPARVEAIALLGVGPFAQGFDVLAGCLAAGQPEDVQVAAIKTLAQQVAPVVTPAMLRAWPHLAPKGREEALMALLSREDRALALLEAVSSGVIKPTELPTSQVQGLVQHANAEIAARAKTVLASVVPRSRAEMAAMFAPAVALPGDAAKGQGHYRARCMVCHRAGAEGMTLGPDLITVKTKGREALLTAILDPNKEVAAAYIAYDVVTKEGQTYVGIIVRDDATSLALKVMGGAEVSLPRAQIKGSSSSGKSPMPEGLESGMSVQDMADLLSFIESL